MSENKQAMCHSCGDPVALTISFEVDGHSVMFYTCHACETKWWEQDGAEADLNVVLPLVVG
ncbi:MAG TPA: hypothetical protein VGB51_08780 [Actinomycetota bacterium]